MSVVALCDLGGVMGAGGRFRFHLAESIRGVAVCAQSCGAAAAGVDSGGLSGGGGTDGGGDGAAAYAGGLGSVAVRTGPRAVRQASIGHTLHDFSAQDDGEAVAGKDRAAVQDFGRRLGGFSHRKSSLLLFFALFALCRRRGLEAGGLVVKPATNSAPAITSEVIGDVSL